MHIVLRLHALVISQPGTEKCHTVDDYISPGYYKVSYSFFGTGDA